jgi:DNA-binding LacI/PurR family transcriptional regulator
VQVGAWRRDGKEAVLLDLDRPETFRDALSGIDRIFLSTGYTVAMIHQSKTMVDAAADAGVKFIVHLGIFGNGRVTYAYGAWRSGPVVLIVSALPEFEITAVCTSRQETADETAKHFGIPHAFADHYKMVSIPTWTSSRSACECLFTISWGWPL